MKFSTLVTSATLLTASSSTGGVHAHIPLHHTPSCNTDLNSVCDDLGSATPLSTLVSAAVASNATRVIVPCNTCAYVDYDDGSTVTLPAHGLDVIGRLVFPPSADVTLATPALVVQGRLDVAAPNEGNSVVLEFYGTEDQYYYPYDKCGGGYDPGCVARHNMGRKAFVVGGGTLEIRAGRSETCPSWTKLRYKESDTVLRVDAEFASCLRGGDELLITSSTTQWNDEVRSTIVGVTVDPTDSSSALVTLDDPLARALPGTRGTSVTYPTCIAGILSGDGDVCCPSSCGACGGSGCGSRPGGATRCCGGGILNSGNVCEDEYDVGCIVYERETVVLLNESEYAVEVASLTRDVVFKARGDGEGHMGGHFIIFHTEYAQVIEGVKFDNFGQGGVLGRYPIHFHMCGSSVGSYVSKNVIVNSNQRCVFIHDTHDVTVQDNVAWNTAGHCYATETGNERDNVFARNLGALTKKLQFWNGQSDSPGFLGRHISATFWVRSMENEWVGNVAAGSQVQGFWLEMKDKESEQTYDFRDNVAHSNGEQGLTTYRPGWKPTNGGVLLNLKIFKNAKDGIKFHATENVVVKGGLFADNLYSVRYGAFNGQVTLQDTVIDAYSNDYYHRINNEASCPFTQWGVTASINGDVNPNKSIPDAIALHSVTFKNFQGCTNLRSIRWEFDKRNYNERGMGDPINATGIAFVNSTRLPFFPCNSKFAQAYLEDVNGVLAPKEYDGPGFIVAGDRYGQMTEFLPEGSCHTLPYSGSNEYQPNGCSLFCEGACLRSVEITPMSDDASIAFERMTLTNQDGKGYGMDSNGRNKPTETGIFFTVLPSGQYTGTFYDESGMEVKPDYVEVKAHTLPNCADYVTEEMFQFELATEPPSQSTAPTPSPPDSFCHDGIQGVASSGVAVCCASSCGQCGGSGCSGFPGGYANCCTGAIATDSGVCSDFTDVGCIMPASQWCEYGVSSGSVCCAGSCGTCGGSGCSSRPGGWSNCCGGAIANSGQVCSSFEDIACVIP